MNHEKYNHWSIISIDCKETSKKYKKVLCRCDCGTEKVVRYDHVKSGRSKSCGCYFKEIMINNISGLKFNQLTAIEISGRNYRGDITWKCLCDCGTIKNIKTSNLITGNTKSCGCLYEATRKRLNLSNLRFGMLVVIKEQSRSSYGILWNCQCDCGNVCYKTSSALNGGGAISCGCAKSSIKKRPAYSSESFRKRSRVASQKRRALKRNAKGSYTKEQIDDLFLKQKSKCANCNKKIDFNYHIDHIIPLSKGGNNDIYNLQLLCYNCNLRKSAIDPIIFSQKEGRLL